MEAVRKWWERLFIPIIIVLVALASFGLGRLSATTGEQGELIITPGEENL